MRSISKLSIMCLLLFSWILTACQSQPEDGILTEYTEERAEIMQTWNEIVESVKAGDIDKLISFHAYSPKFTEFKQGAPRNDAADNETFERGVF